MQTAVIILGICIFAVVAYGDIRTRRIPNELVVAIPALAVVSRDRLGRRAVASPAPEDQDPPARLTVPYGVAIAAAGIVTLLVQLFPPG